MPCVDYGPIYTNDCGHKEKLDFYARSLCYLISQIEDTAVWEHAPDELHKWWQQHKENDRKAIEAKNEIHRLKQLKKVALNKLTKEERKALGL